jgi:hypothetical protein
MGRKPTCGDLWARQSTVRFDFATNAEPVVGTAKAVCNRSGTINKLELVGQFGSGKE